MKSICFILILSLFTSQLSLAYPTLNSEALLTSETVVKEVQPLKGRFERVKDWTLSHLTPGGRKKAEEAKLAEKRLFQEANAAEEQKHWLASKETGREVRAV